jgi:hypothetical protein
VLLPQRSRPVPAGHWDLPCITVGRHHTTG